MTYCELQWCEISVSFKFVCFFYLDDPNEELILPYPAASMGTEQQPTMAPAVLPERQSVITDGREAYNTGNHEESIILACAK